MKGTLANNLGGIIVALSLGVLYTAENRLLKMIVGEILLINMVAALVSV